MGKNKNITVRFPPSPTGLFHVGNARTFLFNYLFAKQNNGKIVFRLEDTDKKRSKKEYEDDIIESLKWLAIEPDFSTMVKQSERSSIYKKYLEKLIEEGKVYLAEDQKNKDLEVNSSNSTSSAQVIRFKNPNKKIIFNDLIRGDIEFNTSELKDFVIAKNLEEPTYHLAAVIDDYEMGVTHVIRGDDGISNTPRQILIQEAIGAPRPIYAHLPMILAPDKTKLSKRKHGQKVSVYYYKNAGYLPEAIINFLVMIGWNPGACLPADMADQEIFSMEELIKIFDIKKVQKKGGIFNIEKLDWLNREWILRSIPEAQSSNLKAQILKTKFADNKKLADEEFFQKFLKITLDRIHRWVEAAEMLEAGEYDYLFEKPTLDKNKICWKKQSLENARENLEKIMAIFENIFTGQENRLEDEIMKLAEREGKGEVLWPLRYALSGREKSPNPFSLLDILGVEESKKRISDVIKILTN